MVVLTADSQSERENIFPQQANNNEAFVGGPCVQFLNATIANTGDVHWVGGVTTQRAVSKALVGVALEQPLKTE